MWSRGTNSRFPFGVNVGMNRNLFILMTSDLDRTNLALK